MKTKTYQAEIVRMGTLGFELQGQVEGFLSHVPKWKNENIPVEVEIGETEDKICIEIRRRNDE